MNLLLGILIGIVLILALRILLIRVLLMKFRRDVAVLNTGDFRPLLKSYAEDAVIVFTDGDHRWTGTHSGKAEIEAFLTEFVRANIQGSIKEVYLGGWVWNMTMIARFDDQAFAPGSTEKIYENRTVLVINTRWGKIIRQEDFYVDTVRMVAFDKRLTELGITHVN